MNAIGVHYYTAEARKSAWIWLASHCLNTGEAPSLGDIPQTAG